MRILDWALALPEVVSDTVLMLGNSGGGMATLHTAAADKRHDCGSVLCATLQHVDLVGINRERARRKPFLFLLRPCDEHLRPEPRSHRLACLSLPNQSATDVTAGCARAAQHRPRPCTRAKGPRHSSAAGSPGRLRRGYVAAVPIPEQVEGDDRCRQRPLTGLLPRRDLLQVAQLSSR